MGGPRKAKKKNSVFPQTNNLWMILRRKLAPAIFFDSGAQTLDLQQKFLTLEKRFDKLALALNHRHLCSVSMSRSCLKEIFKYSETSVSPHRYYSTMKIDGQ